MCQRGSVAAARGQSPRRGSVYVSYHTALLGCWRREGEGGGGEGEGEGRGKGEEGKEKGKGGGRQKRGKEINNGWDITDM